MAHSPTYKVPFRRRREQKTNYAKRLALLKSRELRMVVRKTNNQVIVQFVEAREAGDHVHAAAQSAELKKYGWKLHGGNIAAAYLTGFLAGGKAKKTGVSKAVLDLGLVTPVRGSRVFAALKGAIDAGIHIPASEAAFPKPERLKGKHVEAWLSKNPGLGNAFSRYKKEGVDYSKYSSYVEAAKAAIEQELK
ncbi:MAG: 50S ribosomal protein L18 [Candidatus Diapherotrites archaeon]|nr:50S ribosomal protein L18 [Candidatus Diapherotrites archaeon]